MSRPSLRSALSVGYGMALATVSLVAVAEPRDPIASSVGPPISLASVADPAVARAVAEAVAEAPAGANRAGGEPALTSMDAMARGPRRCTGLESLVKVAFVAACTTSSHCTDPVAAPPLPTAAVTRRYPADANACYVFRSSR